MFQNGLLATFIPEIFMVIGFVMCLIAPGFQSNSSATERPIIVNQISSLEYQQNTKNQVATYYFQLTCDKPIAKQNLSPVFQVEKIKCGYNYHFSASFSLSFVDFSRPPPFYHLEHIT